MRRRTVTSIVALIAVVLVGVTVAVPAVNPFAPATPTVALAAPRFLEEAVRGGLDFRYDGPFTSSVGGGLAVLDCDDDGRPDLYLAGGSRPAARGVPGRGQIIAFHSPTGEDIAGAILAVDADTVRVDFNHTLAGREVLFRVQNLADGPAAAD